jgi:hypothetical protein
LIERAEFQTGRLIAVALFGCAYALPTIVKEILA